MVRDVAAAVTIGNGAGVLLPRRSLDHWIVFFILSRGSVVGVVSWHSDHVDCWGMILLGFVLVLFVLIYFVLVCSPLQKSLSPTVRRCCFFWCWYV
ncbi:hypothetical protein RHMOL_Rhmol06G0275300 [Rhododendron molle]|uniref:Uncharacterized protein n=1 Tax=Rhododendron molle TaxID=49168 RepID=A0ACC0NH14_RHOML|nr:hypothetical protein RHMOL_Rhmol06G0275300 [Rhododendron molle]